MKAGRGRWIWLTVLVLVLVFSTKALAAPYGSRSLYTGRVGADVVELQRRLNSLGYGVGSADGIFGPRTRAALSQFQRDSGLAVDGMAEQWTFQALNRQIAYNRAILYTVKAGDTLSRIAAQHRTTVETLIWLNQMKDHHLLAGQQLRIPAPQEVALPSPAVQAPPPSAVSVTPAPPPAAGPGTPPATDPATPPGPGTGTPPTDSAPPSLPTSPPGEEPGEEAPPAEGGERPQPGHAQWLLPGLLPLDYLILLPPPPVEAQPDPIPPKPNRPLVVGYYAEDWQGDTRALNALKQAGDNVDMVINFQLQIDRDGNLSSRAYPELLAEAKRRGLKLYGLVHNFHGTAFDASVARAVLGSPTVRRHAVEQMYKAVKGLGLDGIDIDIENVPPDQRDNYTALIRELGDRLRPEGYGVSISIPAKTFDDRRSAWSGAFDYPALGKVADKIAIMAYDEHTPGFAAGPVASVGWVDKVAAYAAATMPTEKVLLGIATYGYDWAKGTTRARGLSIPQARSLAARHGAPILWDEKAQVPYFTYKADGVERIVYFEDANSIRPKLDLVAKHRLGGIAIWRLGLEEPAVWSVIAEKLR